MFDDDVVNQIFRTCRQDHARKAVDDHQQHAEQEATAMSPNKLTRISPRVGRCNFLFLRLVYWCAHRFVRCRIQAEARPSGRACPFAKEPSLMVGLLLRFGAIVAAEKRKSKSTVSIE